MSNDERRQPVLWPLVRRFEHAAVLGKSGMGKTHFLEHLAAQHMQRGEGYVYFDFHGDATEHLLGLAAGFPDASDRVVLINPTDDDTSPGLNPLESSGDEQTAFARASELASILRQRWQVEGFGARTEELMRNVLFTLAATGYTLVEAPLLLTSREFRVRLVATLKNPDVASYWQDRYEPLSEPMKGAFREPLLNKITALLTEPACRHLLGQSKSTVSLADAMAKGQWVLVNLAKGQLREHAHTLGNLLFAHLQFSVLGRSSIPPERRRLFAIFCDEAQNLAENDLTTLLAEGRKFGICLAVTGQYWEQTTREMRAALLSAGTHVLFRVSAADASVLAQELSVATRQKYQLQLTELRRGEAIVRIGSDPPIAIRVPILPSLAGQTHINRLRSLSMQQYTRRRCDIETEIRLRRVSAVETSAPLTPYSNEIDHDEGQQGW